jgi:hypothetical protein
MREASAGRRCKVAVDLAQRQAARFVFRFDEDLNRIFGGTASAVFAVRD